MSWPDPNAIDGLSDHQREQLQKACSRQIGIFTGCPGTGKTYSQAAIIKDILMRTPSNQIGVIAPTGKAAVRATESLRKLSVPLRATTAHRFLGVSIRNGRMSFLHDTSTKKDVSYLFCDEWSVAGNSLTHSVLQAIPDNCFVMFIGDHHQLPPVDRGATLRDMIAAGIPAGDLREIRRNAGKIVECCREIREGRPFICSAKPSFFGGPEANLCHLNTTGNIQSQSRLVKVIEQVQSLEGTEEIDAMWDVQVLCAVNDGTELSRRTLNLRLQEMLNHGQESVFGDFRIRDKIICLKNFICEWKVGNDDHEEFIANGQMGQLMAVHGDTVTVALKGMAEGDTMVQMKRKMLEFFDLGYAVSVHKSQGSSWPIVVWMVDDSAKAMFMTSRQLAYTAISRAERYCVVIGPGKCIMEALGKNAIAGRKTMLVQRLIERRAEHDVAHW